MAETRMLEQLLECLIQVVGRVAIPEASVRAVVGQRAKQLKAFNLADGTRSQREIAKQAKVDQGSLSHTFGRWVQSGVAFWITDEGQARLLHIYPLPISTPAKPRKRRIRRRTRR